MYSYTYLFVFLIAAHGVTARILTRCELAQELKRQGFADLPNWVCLVESESSRDTAVIGGPNTDGSYDWGLFQINDRYWCRPGFVGGECNVACESLITDDITVASTCTKMIFNIHGWQGWYGWIAKCQNQPLPDLSMCGV